MLIQQVNTPALFVDLDIMEQNMEIIRAHVETIGLAMRPHYKTNKCAAIVHKQLADGAKGITCAKVSEAEDLVEAGVDDVLIANQVVDSAKIARVATLAGRSRITICVDSEQNIHDLERAAAAQDVTIYCLVEYDIGLNRCGARTKEEVALLAKTIGACPHLSFEGIQAYAGHLSHEEDYGIRKRDSEKIERDLSALRDSLLGQGLSVKEISGVSTGTVFFRTNETVYTEVQAGSYLYMDVAYNKLLLPFQNSLFVMTTVISTADGLIITDAGRKSISFDQEFPLFTEFPDLPVRLSEEHCIVAPQTHQKKAGDKMLLIPGHCCTAVNLYDRLYLVRNNRVVDCVPVTSRGKSQ